jgi:hypothetical protein
VSLLLLKMTCWAKWQLMVPLSTGQLLAGWGWDSFRVLGPQIFLVGMDRHGQFIFFIWEFSKVVLQELVCEHSPVPSTCRANLQAGIELFGHLVFSWKVVSYSSLPVFPRWSNVLLFTPDCGWAAPQFSPLCCPPLPQPGRVEIFPPFI